MYIDPLNKIWESSCLGQHLDPSALHLTQGLYLDDEKVRPTIRHDEPHQRATAVDNQSATGGGSSGDTNGEQPTTGRVSSFKRIYATSRASSTERNAHLVSGETQITPGGSATASSHDHDPRIEQRQPTAGALLLLE
ncbi:hypothetical protein DAPPUDRAFT_234425 [Daphnia pulex]|uniref:Uncharacterized protein n=1 Tax=Daphnia pulex TaxID=6669 RepID=E9FWK9_DAPPU|nr:hypothetical protein DAPPUDRAFT_234425 [Daphnia pulex]|eukprot:EFX88416.1 hypothetical protein DAPPUDRAFT_234425 [Daphnia pulex]